MLSTISKATSSSAKCFNVHRLRPFGGSLHANAINRASLAPSSFLGVGGCAWFYSIYLHGRFGQTVGKMSTRVRVVNALTEEPITFRHALLRDCVPILISIPLLLYNSHLLLIESPVRESSTLNELANWTIYIRGTWWFVELITMLRNDKRRAVHDFIAGTVVVRTNIDEGEED